MQARCTLRCQPIFNQWLLKSLGCEKMKSMKSVKLFLFCIAAVLTVLFAIAVSKPNNTVSVGSNAVTDKSNSVQTDFTEDLTVNDDSADLTESETKEIEEDTTAFSTESEPSVTAPTEETATTQTKPLTTQKQESTATTAVTTPKTTVETTVPRETTKPNTTQTTQKETITKHTTTSVATPADDPEQMTVYYTKSGKRYHYANPCGNGTYYPTTLAEALSRGLTPCQKCVP